MKNIKRGILSFIAIIFLWQVIVTVNHINSTLFPAPLNVLNAFFELVSTGLKLSTSPLPLICHVSMSLIRFFIGYTLAVIFGISLGLILGSYPRVFSYINPVLQVLRPVAPVAWMPFIVLWFGIGNVPAIVIIFIAGFFSNFIIDSFCYCQLRSYLS